MGVTGRDGDQIEFNWINITLFIELELKHSEYLAKKNWGGGGGEYLTLTGLSLDLGREYQNIWIWKWKGLKLTGNLTYGYVNKRIF